MQFFYSKDSQDKIYSSEQVYYRESEDFDWTFIGRITLYEREDGQFVWMVLEPRDSSLYLMSDQPFFNKDKAASFLYQKHHGNL